MRCVKCEKEHENLLSKSHDTIQLLVHDDSITVLRSMTMVYFILHMMMYRVINTKVIQIVKIAKNLIMLTLFEIKSTLESQHNVVS